MHIRFVEYFVDPITKEPMDINITKRSGDIVESGSFKSRTAEYPIINRIPRFIQNSSNKYAESFGYQWRKWPKTQFESENAGKPMAGHTLQMWERITGIRGKLSGQVILDMGCGPGRFIDIGRAKGAEVIGIDYSAEVVECAAKNFYGDPGVCICQASALNLPIKADSLDGAFSIGVLHHTPDPLQGVSEAIKVIKPGAWFALVVYGKNTYYDGVVLNLWRRLFNKLWPISKHYAPLFYTYTIVYCGRIMYHIPYIGKIMNRVLGKFFPYANYADHPDINWALLDTFDSVTPSYQSTHESYEVFHWLKSSGFVNIEPTDWGFTAYRGHKP